MVTDPDEYSDDAIKDLIKNALRSQLEAKKYPNKKALNESLIASMQEFMSSFKVIGYDIDGNLVSLTYAPSDMGKHALIHAFLDEFSKIVGSK